ncbi:hypothetical protein [Acidianus manzaensis]|uniref:Uncharacterized protein n=1 Tax=Acidianus manzaensis TaxID=282676 RepID=A0A1W6JWV4_9CREN|nr:hypothetical protein [Acidianus manzaensis]ARM74761.1 hypothetical protein B6F84_01120 [Acidianus manzaensis]
MRCPIHPYEKKEYAHKKDLVIHLSKSKIEYCPVCKSKIDGYTIKGLKKHLIMCKDDEHKKLLKDLEKIFGNKGLFKKKRISHKTEKI